MKKLVTLALLSASISFADEHEHEEGVLNKAPVVLAGITSVEKFKASFEANGATLASELVGFNSKIVGNEARSAVYKIPEAAKLKDSNFDCQLHLDDNGNAENAHCRDIGESEPRDYVAAAGSYSAEEFKKAAVSAVSVFEEAFAAPKKIKEAKFWRSNLNNEAIIQVKFLWIKEDGTDATNYMFCHNHQHGDEVGLDCHRQRFAGANQP